MRAINLDAGDGSEIYQGPGAQSITFDELTSMGTAPSPIAQFNNPWLWIAAGMLVFVLTAE